MRKAVHALALAALLVMALLFYSENGARGGRRAQERLAYGMGGALVVALMTKKLCCWSC